MRGVGLDLSPQTQNLNVDRTVINVIVEPARFQKLVSGQHMPRRSEKRVQQAELAVGQLDSDTCWIGQLDRKSTRLNSSHIQKSRMPSSA